MADEGFTTIRISMRTKERLQRQGAMGEDYEAVIDRLLARAESRAVKKDGTIKG
jgi:hypothetical protein